MIFSLINCLIFFTKQLCASLGIWYSACVRVCLTVQILILLLSIHTSTLRFVKVFFVRRMVLLCVLCYAREMWNRRQTFKQYSKKCLCRRQLRLQMREGKDSVTVNFRTITITFFFLTMKQEVLCCGRSAMPQTFLVPYRSEE